MAKYWTGYFGAPCYYPENLPSAKAMKAAADITPTVDVGPQATGSYYVRFAATSGYAAVGRVNDGKAFRTLPVIPGIPGGVIGGSSAPRSPFGVRGGLTVSTPGAGQGGGGISRPTLPTFGQRPVKSPIKVTLSPKAATKATFTLGKQSSAPKSPFSIKDAQSKPTWVAAAARKAAEAKAAQVAAKMQIPSLATPATDSLAPSESPPLPAVTVPTSSGGGGGGGFYGGGGGGGGATEFDETTDVDAPAEDGTAKRNKMLMIAGAAAVGLYLWSKRKK